MKEKEDANAKWMQQGKLGAEWGMSRATMWKLVGKMREYPEFASGIIDVSQKLHLVNVDMFEKFMRSIDKQYLKTSKAKVQERK